MKKATLFLSMGLSVLFLLNSCTKEETDDRDDFVGSWRLHETYTITGWGTGTEDYNITITKSSAESNKILISNFGNVDAGFVVDATVSGNSFTISTSVTYDGDVFSITGSGSLSNGQLNLNYNISGYWSGVCTGTKM